MPIFERFFDDAAIFPPGLAPLDSAVKNHIDRKKHQVAPLVGSLVLPIDQLKAAGDLAEGASVEVSAVITDQEVDRLRLFLDDHSPAQNVSVIAAEVKLDPGSETEGWKKRLSQLQAEYPHLKTWVELPYDRISDEVLRWLGEEGLQLKFRTGGIRSELFPAPEELVEVLRCAVDNKIPFKLTAGLHRAMRYTNPKTGFAHFGFLNIAAAVRTLQDSKDESAALAVLNSDDSVQVKAAATDRKSWRDTFVSFGTCSVVEPLETLVELDLYSKEDIPAA